MQLNTIDMGLIGVGPMGNLTPEVLVFALPYIFKGWEHLEKVLRSDVIKRVDEIYLEKTGLRILGWMEQGFRETITVKKPITRLEDFEGMKLRMTEDDVLIKTFKLFGARPTVMPWGESYTAMQTGLVDGMESTPTGINSMKFYEVTNYVSLTGHQHTIMAIIIRESLWKKLDSETQKIFQDAAKRAVELNYKECPIANATAYMELIRNNKACYVPDLGPFMEAVKPLIEEWGEKTKTTKLIEEIKSIK
jgi:tripartite ATP-independent transporter DctP family solute receptor